MSWWSENWFNLLQSAGIVGSLLFTAYQLKQYSHGQQVANLFQITQYHRDIWSLVLDNPELLRIREDSPDLVNNPVTDMERLWVKLLILHLNCTYEAVSAKAIRPIEGMEEDVKTFFRKPIPSIVWSELRHYQNAQFRRFVEDRVD